MPLPLGYGAVCRYRSCGSWNRTNGLLVQSQALLPTATTPQKQARIRYSRFIHIRVLHSAIVRSRFEFMRCGRRGSRTLKACLHTLGCFQDSCHHLLACPPVRIRHLTGSSTIAFPRTAVAGFEPAIVSLTGSCPTVGPHRIESLCFGGFTFNSAESSPNCSAQVAVAAHSRPRR